MELVTEIDNYLKENREHLFADDLNTCYYVYANANRKQIEVLEIEDKLTVFIRHQDDCEDFNMNNGMSFENKIFHLGYEPCGGWIKVSIRVLYEINKKFNLVHPSSLRSVQTPEGIYIDIAN